MTTSTEHGSAYPPNLNGKVAPLRRPGPILAYLVLSPALTVMYVGAQQYAPAVLSVGLGAFSYWSLRTIDRQSAAAFERRVRAAALMAFKAGIEADTRRVDRAFALLPEPAPELGYLYAVQFSTGVVKVGQTVHPRGRLRKHRRDAQALGVAVVHVWTSPPHTNYLQNEAALIRACARISGRRHKNEYFQNIDLAAVLRLAAALSMKDIPSEVPA